MKAKDIQIGGRHYRKMAIQPFEFCIANDLGGVEHTIVKYVSRWPDKGGLEDVLKSRHCVDFLIDNAPALIASRTPFLPRQPEITARQYCTANRLGHFETEVVRWIYFWSHNGQVLNLEAAAKACDSLINKIMAGGDHDGA